MFFIWKLGGTDQQSINEQLIIFLGIVLSVSLSKRLDRILYLLENIAR